MLRQRDYLEKTVADLRAQLKHEAQTNTKRTTAALQVMVSADLLHNLTAMGHL